MNELFEDIGLAFVTILFFALLIIALTISPPPTRQECGAHSVEKACQQYYSDWSK